MIFTFLFYTFLNKNDTQSFNRHKMIYYYSIGAILYIILHWLLFSSLGNNNELIKKYRYLIYIIFAMDISFTSYKYNSLNSKNDENLNCCSENNCCVRKRISNDEQYYQKQQSPQEIPQEIPQEQQQEQPQEQPQEQQLQENITFPTYNQENITLPTYNKKND